VNQNPFRGARGIKKISGEIFPRFGATALWEIGRGHPTVDTPSNGWNSDMKMTKWLFAAVMWGCLGLVQSRADDLFQVLWRVTYYAKNSTGHIVAVPFSERDLVNEVAQNTGRDPSQLVLVFRPRKHDIAVVQSNGAFVASVIQMQTTTTDIVNPSGGVIVRHALLSDPAHPAPLGSFFGLELRSFNSNGTLASASLTGTVLYSKPDTATVYGGQVRTGDRVPDSSNAP
jgi:hypothetical protein